MGVQQQMGAQQMAQQVAPAPVAPVAQEVRPEEVIPLDESDLKSF